MTKSCKSDALDKSKLPEIVRDILIAIKQDLDTIYQMTPYRIDGFRFYEHGIYVIKTIDGKEVPSVDRDYAWEAVLKYYEHLQKSR